MHWCMGEVVDWGFSQSNNENCPNCGMKEIESKGCCKNEQKLIKSDHGQKVSDASYRLQSTSTAVIYAVFECIAGNVASLTDAHLLIDAPRQDLPLFIRNCVFRI